MVGPEFEPGRRMEPINCVVAHLLIAHANYQEIVLEPGPTLHVAGNGNNFPITVHLSRLFERRQGVGAPH